MLQGPVTVFVMSVPVIFSLIALLKVETAKGIYLSNKVAQALALIHQQLIHLNAREDLHVPLDVLMVWLSKQDTVSSTILFWLSLYAICASLTVVSTYWSMYDNIMDWSYSPLYCSSKIYEIDHLLCIQVHQDIAFRVSCSTRVYCLSCLLSKPCLKKMALFP